MPDGTDEYRELVLEARQEALQEMAQRARRRLAETYARQTGELIEELDSIPEGAGRQRVERLIDELEDSLKRYAARGNLQVQDLSEETARLVAEAHENGLSAVSRASGQNLSAAFGAVPERAMESMAVRRGLDVTGSFKTLSHFQAEQHAEAVRQAVDDMVGKGDTYQEASEKIARALATGDDELEAALDRFGLRGGLRAGETGPINTAVQQEAKRLGYNARRIAVSEVQNAYWESDRLANVKSPVVKGVRWTLSNSHPRTDICDVYATQDVHGLGAGVYRAESVPPKPHPFCLCSQSPVFREPSQWNQSQPEVPEPRELSSTTVEDILDDPTDREIERVTEMFNDQTQQAYESWTQS